MPKRSKVCSFFTCSFWCQSFCEVLAALEKGVHTGTGGGGGGGGLSANPGIFGLMMT